MTVAPSIGRPPVSRGQAATYREWAGEQADTWPGTWTGWCAAFRHELSRLLGEGVPFDEAESQAVENLPKPPRIAEERQERLCR